MEDYILQTLHIRYSADHILTDSERCLASLLIRERLADVAVSAEYGAHGGHAPACAGHHRLAPTNAGIAEANSEDTLEALPGENSDLTPLGPCI